MRALAEIGPRAPVAAILAGALLALTPSLAGAVVYDEQLIAGPSSSLTGDVEAAMAEDGTGGVAYLQNVGGRDHVYAARFADRRWSAPRRIDVGQSFDSSWVQIAAGDGGRLLVTWVQEFGAGSDRMFSATLDPGASGFRSPVPVDFDVNEATSTFPDLAMNRGGTAYLVYNVVTDTSANNPPGYLGAEVRMARYANRLWTPFGGPIDRNNSIPVRIPAEEIGPQVGIDVQGQGVVAWQEPDDEFVDRVWARRLFGARTGIPLQVSPSTWEGAPLRGRADAFALDVAGFGQSAVAFRQQPGQASRLPGTRVMVNQIPEVFAEGAASFGQAILTDGAPRSGPGAPSVGVDANGLYITGFGTGNATLTGAGDAAEMFEVARVDAGGSGTSGEPVVDNGESTAAVVAWREVRSNAGLVQVQERRADGVFEPSTLQAPNGGSVGRLTLGGSGLGDAIIAWSQGTGSNRQIVASVLDAPPDPFFVLLPTGWQRRKKIPISWDEVRNAVGDVTYSVSVDDEPVVEGVVGEQTKLTKKEIGNGTVSVQVFAEDEAGQETGSLPDQLKVDRRAPRVKVRSRGFAATVRVADGSKKKGSGVKSARVSFGDGSRSTAKGGRKRKARHRFGRPGTYTVRVKTKDKAGNKGMKRKKVRVG